MTGWSSELPEAEVPAVPLAGMLAANRERGAGDTLAIAAARSRANDAREAREAEASAPDPDGRAATLVTRGILPGMTSDLARRLGDTLAELQGEREKIERGRRRAEQVRRAHENGQVTAFDIARMDFDEGDEGLAERLERRAESLLWQVRDAAELASPQRERPADPLEAVSRHAHEVFREVTRQRMAEAQSGRPGPRPFAGRGRGAVRSEPVTCPDCVKYGATPEQSFLIHQDPSPLEPPAAVSEAEQDWLSGRDAERGEVIDRWPASYDTYGRTITRADGYPAMPLAQLLTANRERGAGQ